MWHALGKDELFIVYRIHGMIPSVVTCFCDIIVNGEGVSFVLCCWVDLFIYLFIYCACFTTAISLEWVSQHGHTHTSMLDTDTPTHQHTHTHTLSVGGVEGGGPYHKRTWPWRKVASKQLTTGEDAQVKPRISPVTGCGVGGRRSGVPVPTAEKGPGLGQ